jgi:hypothetical protein
MFIPIRETKRHFGTKSLEKLIQDLVRNIEGRRQEISSEKS